MTEEEFIESVDGGAELMIYMKRWESSPEFKRLMCLLKEDNFAMDLLDVRTSQRKQKMNVTHKQ